MTKLALHGLRSLQHVQDLGEEDRATYRRWARRLFAVYAIVLVALFVGFFLRDRQTSRVARSDLSAGVELMAVPASPQEAGRDRKPHNF